MIKQFISRILGGNLVGKIRGKKNTSALPEKTPESPTKSKKSPKKRLASGEIIYVGTHKITRNLIPSHAKRVVETLQEHDFAAFIVGGAVRDLLLNKTPKDFDVATNATPEEVRRIFRRSRIIGRRFQIVHVMMGNETIEVTTFRAPHVKETAQTTHTSQADEEGRLLRDNVFGTQKEDAARRDFTVNGFYYDPSDETLIDYHHGFADLQKRTLRMIGEPVLRYREDPVRMLRAVRFAAKLQFSIEEKTRAPIVQLAHLISNIPSSRLIDEMLKLLTSGAAYACLEKLREEGLHQNVLPLLDVLDQPENAAFIKLALSKTDLRVKEGKKISVGFLFSALLWQNVRVRWEALEGTSRNENEPPLKPLSALFLAVDEVLEKESKKLEITHRISGDMKDIWGLQARFLMRSGKRPFALLAQMRFRAAYDFLLLRVESGEVPEEIGNWWTDFVEADAEKRNEMLLPVQAGEGKKRRVRKKKVVVENTENA